MLKQTLRYSAALLVMTLCLPATGLANVDLLLVPQARQR